MISNMLPKKGDHCSVGTRTAPHNGGQPEDSCLRGDVSVFNGGMAFQFANEMVGTTTSRNDVKSVPFFVFKDKSGLNRIECARQERDPLAHDLIGRAQPHDTTGE